MLCQISKWFMSQKKESYWIKNGKLTLLQRVSMLTFGVMNFYLLVRMMEKEDYGIWMLFVSISTLIQTTREGFFKKPLIRYINDLNGRDIEKLQGSSIILNVSFSIVSSLLLILISPFLANIWDAPDISKLIVIFFFTNILSGLFSHSNNVLEANFKFKGPLIANTLKSGILFSCILYNYLLGNTIDVILLCYYDLASVMVVTLVILFFSRKYQSRQLVWKPSMLRKLFDYGKYTLGTNISGIVLRNIDIWMIGWYMSPESVAVYNVAIRITNLFEVPIMAMASIIFPQAVRKSKLEGKSAFKNLYEKSLSVILLLVIPMVVGGIALSDLIIWILAGESYQEAADLLKVTMLLGLTVPFGKQMGILLDATGRARLNMLFVIRNAVINIILNAILIPYFGTIGAALATLSSSFMILIINQIFLNRNYDVSLTNLVSYSRQYIFELRKQIQARVSG